MRSKHHLQAPLTLAYSTILFIAVAGPAYGQFSDWLHPTPPTMTLVRKLPPIINVKDASFRIEASSTSTTVPPDVVNTLITKTRGLLLKDRDRSLRLDDTNPNYTLRCKVTGFELTQQQRSVGTGNQVSNYVFVIGTIEATVEVLDSSKGALDSDNLKSHFEREYLVGGMGNVFDRSKSAKGRVPTPLEQRDLVVEGLAAKVAQHLVSVEEDVEIRLPYPASFKEMQELARRKRWVELQEAAQRMTPPKKKEEDDSYRLYMLGLSYEGLAYDKAKSDPEAAKDLLTKAFATYSDAKQKKIKESYFVQPEIRSQESLDSYIAIEHFKKLASVANRAAVSPTPSVQNVAVGTPPPGPKKSSIPSEWNNEAVIALKKQGLPDSTLITLIKTAPNPKFDISPSGVLDLAQNGCGPLVDTIMAAMQPAAQPRQRPVSRPVPPAQNTGAQKKAQ